MLRRNFVKSAFATAGLSVGNASLWANNSNVLPEKNSFKLNYAPHFGMFKNSAGDDLMAQLQFMADAGFMALEDNEMMSRTVEVQTKIGEKLANLNMKMGVFVINSNGNWKTSLATGKQEFKDEFLKTCRTAVEVAKRCNAKYMTVVPGMFDRNIPIGIQTGHVIDALRQAAAIFEPHNLTMVLEPLSDTPDLFLRTSDQTYAICRAVNSPACKLLFDMYHMQKNEGHLIHNINLTWDEIGYFQIGDNPGRNEPTTGEINYKNIFKHIYTKSKASNRSFIFGMEHGNAKAGKDGETALIRAYVESDAFVV